MQYFRLALSFLTRLPIPCPMIEGKGALARAMSFFPWVGLIVGALAGGVFYGADWLLPRPLAAFLAVLTSVLVTGGLHEDGLADCADGLGARGDRDQRLLVMRDSRSGTYGVLALLFSVGLRCAALSAAPSALAGGLALLAAHTIARALIPAAMQIIPPARPDGLGHMAGQPDATIAAIAMGQGLLLCLLCLGAAAPYVVMLSVALVLGIIHLARRLLGGHTGDVLGAIEQAGEIATLLVAAGFWTC